MAELSAAAHSGVAASERDVLLATKLYVPRLQPGFVPVPRLVDALDEGLTRRLILVCAPAGFGKTALLTDWSRRGSRPVAWLSLDAGDNDPARFWRHAVAALDRVRPGIGQRAGPLLGPPTPSSSEGLVTALALGHLPPQRHFRPSLLALLWSRIDGGRVERPGHHAMREQAARTALPPATAGLQATEGGSLPG
jgi:hypothetical protein